MELMPVYLRTFKHVIKAIPKAGQKNKTGMNCLGYALPCKGTPTGTGVIKEEKPGRGGRVAAGLIL